MPESHGRESNRNTDRSQAEHKYGIAFTRMGSSCRYHSCRPEVVISLECFVPIFRKYFRECVSLPIMPPCRQATRADMHRAFSMSRLFPTPQRRKQCSYLY